MSMGTIPVHVAQDVAREFNLDQVIIIGRKTGDDGIEHVVTYGDGPAHCEAAARAGMAVKHHLMQWPAPLFDSALRISGVGRDHENPRFVSVCLNRVATDDDLRMIHEMLRPATQSPEQIERERS